MTDANPSIEQSAGGGECVLLHNSLPHEQSMDISSEQGAKLFGDPVRIITCQTPADFEPAFDAIECALSGGLYVAGVFTYELGYYLEPFLETLAPQTDAPLFQVGVFKTMTHLSPDEANQFISKRAFPKDEVSPHDGNLNSNWERPCYDARYADLREYILAGDIYQANLTFPLEFQWSGDVWQLYGLLSSYQKVAFGAVLELPDHQVASLSPELFFRKCGNVITCRPMKGTIRRGQTETEDRELKEWLPLDPKNRAENLMIVDLIRNDLGRLARVGSVNVDNMYAVETYSTLHQMVSTVRAEVAGEPTVLDIFRRLFPCGSVTGAPKIRAMEIIAELEDTARGVYTGAIGYITPQRDMCFSVPIRTMTLHNQGKARLGVGSGVVADSEGAAEYDECILKSKFLKNALMFGAEIPSLIETMLGIDGSIPLLKDHQARLRSSAAYLGVHFHEEHLWQEVFGHIKGNVGASRIRLVLAASGVWSVVSAPLDKLPHVPTVIVSNERLCSSDPLLGHKTTRREVYELARSALDRVDNGFDVLLFNERDELCEGAISNIFLELNGELVTPAKECGLLPGIFRAKVIKDHSAKERVLYVDDLHQADKVYLCNAVRGLLEIQIVEAEKRVKP